jgi:hypothetical protein
MGGWFSRDQDGWEGFMEIERTELYERAAGKMARALGHALPGESQEVLDRIAAEEQRTRPNFCAFER